MKNLASRSLLPFLLLLLSVPASAQLYKENKYLEYSTLFKRYYYREPVKFQFGAGVAASRGDYCGSWNCNRFGIYLDAGIFTTIQPGISAGIELAYFGLGAQNKYSTSDTILNFRGNNLAILGILRINLLEDRSSHPGQVHRKSPRAMPYLRVGIGALAYSVRTYLGTERFTPKRPEGATVKYPAVAVVVPIGGGLAIRCNYRTFIQPELNYHFTTSDALDGAVGLFSKKKYDGYGVASIKVQYAF